MSAIGTYFRREWWPFLKPAAAVMAALTATFLCNAGIIRDVTDIAYPPITGTAYVTDGDTIRIGAVKIRLKGVDAPEMRHRGGSMARTAMREIIGSSPLYCRPDGTRTHGRIVATCYRNTDDRNIGLELIRLGYALDCARFSGGEYAFYETKQARAEQSRASYCRRK